jgi:aldose 1-epimerase
MLSMRTTVGWCALGALVLACGAREAAPPSETPSSSRVAAPRQYAPSYFEIRREDFQGEVDGKQVDLFTIENRGGAFAKITNLGAKLEQLVVADASGRWGDVVLGYPSLAAVRAGQLSMGGFMGRYAGRIAGSTFQVDGVERSGGRFELDGKTFTIPANDGTRANTVHGGARGARFRVFDATQLSPASVRMTLDFAAGEDAAPGFTGFPASVHLEVTYTLTDQDDLDISYRATALDAPTVVNFTHHAFFNLANTPGSPITNHLLRIDADEFLELDAALIPTGVLRKVAGTPLDFRSPQPVGANIGKVEYDMLARINPESGGYDHTYVIRGYAAAQLKHDATVIEPESGRTLDVWSTEPGLQLYTGNNLAAEAPRDVGKGGVPYPSRSGICLEPMHYSDSPNRPSFPSTKLGAGETYSGRIVYAFGTMEDGSSAEAPEPPVGVK